MSTIRILITGFALYAMFFGAGNVIFPLLLGQSTTGNVWIAVLGFGITAVVVPLLGLVTMLIFRADFSRFFGPFGKRAMYVALAILQLLLGPFGVIPRLITLMHAMLQSYLGDISLMHFSILCSLVILLCSFKREQIIKLLGGVLTPVLLLSLIALVGIGLSGQSLPMPSFDWGSLYEGMYTGYNTMDLIAALMFAGVVMPMFTEGEIKPMLASSAVAGGLLFLSYIGLSLVASLHGGGIICPKQLLLHEIACHLLGNTGAVIATIAIVTACLTTAITLTSIFATYLQSGSYVRRPWALSGTLLIAILFANVGFEGISAFLHPILIVLYPCLIALTLWNCGRIIWQYSQKNPEAR